MQRPFGNYPLLAFLMSVAVTTAASAGNWLQLHQLNQTNRQKLDNLQDDYNEQHSPATSPTEQLSRRQFNRQQKLQQQSLQRGQLNKQQIQSQRDRSYPGDRSSKLEGAIRQQRFRSEQQWQLQHFRRQQQLRVRPR